MQPETYMLLHRMVSAAATRDDLEIVLKRFLEIAKVTKDSMYGQDMFDRAWALSCMAGIYARLKEPLLAERAYRAAVELFDANDMSFNASVMRLSLANFLAQRGRYEDAEDTLRQNMLCLIRDWGVADHRVFSADEELRHFQLTGEVIEACRHNWCQACDIGNFGSDFDQQNTDKAGS